MPCCPNCGFGLNEEEPLTYGNVRFADEGEIVFEGRRLHLTRGLHEIARALISVQGRPLTRGFLAARLQDELSDEAIVKSIERLRRVFRERDAGFDQIETLRGFGAYRWRFKPVQDRRPGTATH